MGAYQSTPVTKCESVDSENSRVRYGASSMQGWRRTQEDALNCCPDFDTETESMLYAVYDGHGGSEVAEYCSKHFPDFIKQLDEYKKNSIEEALIKGFIEFDRHLTLDETVQQLKELANRPESPVPPNVLKLAKTQAVGDDNGEDDEFDDSAPIDCDEDETANLLEDASTPIEEVLHKLTNGAVKAPTNTETSSSKTEETAADSSAQAGSSSSETAGSCGSQAATAGSSGISSLKMDTSSDSSESSEEEYNEEPDSDSEEDDEEENLEEMKVSQEMAIKFTQSDEYVELPGSDSGCTACLALIRDNKLYVANAGDSRCVLSRSGKAIDMSVDHKPEDAVEKERIDKAGGFVTLDGRVNGNLNLSRAIGDHNYKRNRALELKEQMITPLPDVQIQTLTPNDDFIIVACDGIWNSLSSQQCVDFVKEKLERGDKISQICEDLFHSVLAEDTVDGDGTGCDNMTCIIIDLQKSTRPDPKNHRTSSTGFDHTISDDIPSQGAEEPPTKKPKQL